jgi:hypothetical protein
VVFAAGFCCSAICGNLGNSVKEQPSANSVGTGNIADAVAAPEEGIASLFSTAPKERLSPYDWVKEEQIHVYADRIVIDLEDAEWATFTDTGSMDPIIDSGSNAIEIVPSSPEAIHLGDIVSYESKYASGTIIHRVDEIGNDQDGWYCRLKGDNLEQADPGKVRFDQIRRVVVAIIY